jgi:hypothetical protein
MEGRCSYTPAAALKRDKIFIQQSLEDWLKGGVPPKLFMGFLRVSYPPENSF